MNLLYRLWEDEDGQGMIEYALILALILIAIVVVASTMGDKIKALLNKPDDGAAQYTTLGGNLG